MRQMYPEWLIWHIQQLSVSNLVDGLRDPEISQLVRLARYKTISEALAQALEIEAAKQASRGQTRKVRQVRTYQRDKTMGTTSGHAIDSMLEFLQKLKNEQETENSTNKRKPIRYWTCACGVEGHVKSRCPQPPTEQNQGNAN
ncbi:hypothetical protein NQ315_012753 [Exocentrus adspersus]|uniref:CCHC-type domain-containing protein n=1 Tax=Exocentrus adspersus TaxID=1586481 RepID=A0AAV8V5H7_9CUCU|nr:hypothetical protein NQ315_012753 [Exocentrus adspersus]